MPTHDTGDLVARLPADRVAGLIADGGGEPFGPGESAFEEWVLVRATSEDRWTASSPRHSRSTAPVEPTSP